MCCRRSSLLVLTTVIGVAVAGCSTLLTVRPADDHPAMSAAIHVDPSGKFARRLSGASQATLLYARSVHVEPVVRPVSHASTGASLLVKSVGGMLRRVVINLFQEPALDDTFLPPELNAPMNLDAFEKTLDRITGTRQNNGTIEFLVDGTAYFEQLESAIHHASDSIDIRTYIFDNDDYAVSFAELLIERARNNVRVRVMFDSLGTVQALQVDPETLPRNFAMPLSIINVLRSEKNVKVRSIANPWLAGDHTKTTIIDQRVAYLGGMNIGREYRYEWHDLMMAVRGPIVAQIQFESDKAWSRAGPLGDLANLFTYLRGHRAAGEVQGYPIRILQTRNFDADIYKAQIAAIRQSRRYILIENAYFSDDRILYELARARRRGVDVRVILPQSSNHGPLNASNRVTINEMLKHKIRVYRYPGMSHVKAAIYDGWACMGSANFDKMSLHVNKEMNLATSHPETVSALMAKVFIPDLMRSEEVLQPLTVTFAEKIAEVIADEAL